MSPAMSRREFLAATGALMATAAIPTVFAAAAEARKKELSALVLSSDVYASPQPQRFVFAIARGPQYASSQAAKVAFAAPGAQEGTVLATRLYKKGLPKGRGVYVVDTAFPEAGIWNAIAFTQGRKASFAVQVNPAPVAPVVGSAALRVPSPTMTNHLGVNPICTRQPHCPLHDVSLDQLIGAGTPVAVMFATPALCQSRYCGPVLDELLRVRDQYGERIRFHHVEIYKSNRGNELAPTTKAWGLPSEPWLYAIDGTGTIRSRLDGAMGQDEIVSSLDALVA